MMAMIDGVRQEGLMSSGDAMGSDWAGALVLVTLIVIWFGWWMGKSGGGKGGEMVMNRKER